MVKHFFADSDITFYTICAKWKNVTFLKTKNARLS
jgi:hypothetical protein